MRIETDTRFFVVIDPSGHSTEIVDILFETTLRGLELQFRGGLTCERRPTLFTERDEAEQEARRRLEAWKTYQEALTGTKGRASRPSKTPSRSSSSSSKPTVGRSTPSCSTAATSASWPGGWRRNGCPSASGPSPHEDIARFVASPVARCRPDGRPKTGTSVNALRTSLRQFFSWCHEAGYTRSNPARLLRRAICSPPPPRGLTDDEERRLLEMLDRGTSFEARRDAGLVRLMLGTGLRLSSALALRVEDVDLVSRELTIRSAKGNRPDRLPISTEVARVLADWIGNRTEGALFGSRAGAPISPRHVQRRFRLAVRRAGIKRQVSPHSCRHAFATRLARTGDVTVVQAALRHRSIASTLVYARVDGARLRSVLG